MTVHVRVVPPSAAACLRAPRPHRGGVSWLGVVLTALTSVAPAHCETLVVLNQTIPPLIARFCPTLNDAKLQADRSSDAAKRPFDRMYINASHNPKCEVLKLTILPLREEEAIRPFEAWSASYDENGPDHINFDVDGKEVPIRVSFRIQLVRYYYAKVMDARGRWFFAWVDLPNEPYLLKYLAERGRFSK